MKPFTANASSALIWMSSLLFHAHNFLQQSQSNHVRTCSTHTYTHNSLCKCVDLHMDVESKLFTPRFASAQSNQSLCACHAGSHRLGVQAVEAHTSRKLLRHMAHQTVHSSSQLEDGKQLIHQWGNKTTEGKTLLSNTCETWELWPTTATIGQIQGCLGIHDLHDIHDLHIYVPATSVLFVLLRRSQVAKTQIEPNSHQVRLSCRSCPQLSLGSWSCSPAGCLLEVKKNSFRWVSGRALEWNEFWRTREEETLQGYI